MNILHVVPSFFPAMTWGGPIVTTKAICDGVARTPGLALRVLTTDAAGPEWWNRVTPSALPYPVQRHRRLCRHAVAPGLLARLPGAIRWADVVHLTGTYSFPTLPTLALARALDRPVVWSPRGARQATHAWDDAPNKRAKSIFETAARYVRPRNVVMHVTSAAEAAACAARLPGIGTSEIPNAVDVPFLPEREPRTSERLRLIFMGRLHPKKGGDLLCDAMMHLPRHITLDIYGTGDPAYVAHLQDMADVLDGRVVLHGHVDGAAKSRAFARADLFVLPSHSENFGIAVAEAMAHALPVITTNATPWQGINRRDCGACIDLAQDDLAATILALSRRDLRAMGRRGRDWMSHSFSNDTMVGQFLTLYRSMVGPSARAAIA